MIGLHKDVLSFEIFEAGNPKTLVFVDTSSYMNKHPERPLVEITMPGYTKYFLANIDARKVNVLNSSTIGFNRVLQESDLVDLPDGIWTFKFKICPYKYVYIIKHDIRITSLLKDIEKIFEVTDLENSLAAHDNDFLGDMAQINILLEGAKAVVNKDTKKAYNYYQLASAIVKKQLNKYCKNCK